MNEHVNAALLATAAMLAMSVALMGMSMGADAAFGAILYGVAATVLGIALGWSAASLRASGSRK